MDNLKKTEQMSDALYLFSLLYKHKIFIIITVILATIISIIVSSRLPVWYASEVNFVPPQESGSSFNSGTSSINAVMKDFGLSKMSGGKSGEYSMLVFLQSRTVLDSLIKKYNLAQVYDIPDTLLSLVRPALLSNVKIEYTDEGNYTITIWDRDKQRAANIANDYVNIANYVANKTYHEELTVNINYLESRINSIDSNIKSISLELTKISKTNLMFAPEEQSKAASTSLGSLKSMAMEYETIYDYYKSIYGENDPATMSAKEMVKAANTKVKEAYNKPGFIGNFALTDATPVAINYLTKYTDIEALIKTKTFLTTTLEKTIIDRGKYVNNFFIIDKAVPADKKDKPTRSLIVIGSIVGSFILYVFILLLINSLKIALNNMKSIENARK